MRNWDKHLIFELAILSKLARGKLLTGKQPRLIAQPSNGERTKRDCSYSFPSSMRIQAEALTFAGVSWVFGRG